METSSQKGHKAFTKQELTSTSRIKRARAKLALDEDDKVGKGQTMPGHGGQSDDLVFIIYSKDNEHYLNVLVVYVYS